MVGDYSADYLTYFDELAFIFDFFTSLSLRGNTTYLSTVTTNATKTSKLITNVNHIDLILSV